MDPALILPHTTADGVPSHTREQPFWSMSADEAFEALASRPEGLNTAEADLRLARDGANLIQTSVQWSILGKVSRRLTEPLTAILLISAGFSGATGDWRSFLIIVLIVAMSIVLDVVQEHKAENTIEALKRSVAVTARVQRDGAFQELLVKDIVRGDVVELKAGDLVPADGIILSSRAALANEASLTGEPYPVEKSPGVSRSATPAEAQNALFAGTSLVGGEALMLVAVTGTATNLGAIAASMRASEPPTAFEQGIHRLGMLILRMTAFLVLFVLLTQLAQHGLSLESVMFSVALAVGLTPELLPMIMTVTLARGAVRMAERSVVVKRLSAIHDLGAMTVLCTDKTGTLTEAKIAHVGSYDATGRDSPCVADLIRLNSHFAGGMRSSLDDAILASGPLADVGWRKLDDAPFDFDRRRSSVLLARRGEVRLITKGAPEAVLALSTHVVGADGAVRQLDAATRAVISDSFEAKGREGLRLLGVAYRPMDGETHVVSPSDEVEMIFAGCAAFLDPPKVTAGDAVKRLVDAGVGIKIISGDAAPVVLHLVEMLALPARGVLTGEEIAALGERALAEKVASNDLFVRIAPDQKARIVRALRLRGYTVGFLGDGINDAPAIHAADVGLSVDGGTEVARQAADIILLAPDLGVLADGVAEGRRTYANIMKYVRMGTSSNFGNMLSMALASLVLPFLPLTPLQILLNNLLYDLSEIGIPFDSADRDMLAKPQAWDIGSVLGFTLVMGPLSSLFDLGTFALLHYAFAADVEVFRTAWFVESIITQILVIFVIRTAGPIFLSRPDRILAATSLGALAIALSIALTPLGSFIGFVALPPTILLAVILVSVIYLAAAEALKPVAMRAHRQR